MKNNRKHRGWMTKIRLAMFCMGLLMLTGCTGTQSQFVMVSEVVGTGQVQSANENAQSSTSQVTGTDGISDVSAPQQGKADDTGSVAGSRETKSFGAGDSQEAVEQMVYVHVCGAVQNPGVYALPMTSRVFEALEAAGGCTEEAAQESVNQARILTDGEELYIPKRDEILSGSQVMVDSLPVTADEPVKSAENKININTADVTELTSLNGIGTSRAQAIIDWREKNGGFSSIEEIKNIDGIADKTYEKLKDRITVN